MTHTASPSTTPVSADAIPRTAQFSLTLHSAQRADPRADAEAVRRLLALLLSRRIAQASPKKGERIA
jgi:hypothetical protein